VTIPSIENWLHKLQFNLEADDLVQDLLSQKSGYMIIGGRTGIGKTILGFHLAFCLATGVPFFGLEVKKCNIGYITFEGAEDKMSYRFYKIMKNFPPTEGKLHFSIEKPIKLKNDNKKLAEMINGFDVVFFDPVKYMVVGDYIKPSIANEFTMQLLDFTEKQALVAILLLQIRKPNENSLLYPGDSFEIKGAADYVESATSVLILERKRQGHKSKGEKGFAPINPDNVMLYFDKHRDAIGGLPPKELLLNREKLIFEEVLSKQ